LLLFTQILAEQNACYPPASRNTTWKQKDAALAKMERQKREAARQKRRAAADAATAKLKAMGGA